jgi:hypothetical protein
LLRTGRIRNDGRRRAIGKLFVLAAALVAAAVLSQSAAAVPPTTIDSSSAGTFQFAAGTLCSFAIDMDYSQQSTTTTFYGNDGLVSQRIFEATEQDTFSANGKTLAGDTYHFMFRAEFENGVRVDRDANGVLERVNLPDGSIFIIAGRVDISAGGGFITTVDSGNSGNNIGAFCAALS